MQVLHLEAIDMVKKIPADTVGVVNNSLSNDQNNSSSKKSSGMPMKMLMAQEMLRDKKSMQKPSNAVARLMGLDPMPVQQPKRSSHYKDVHEVRQQFSRGGQFEDKYPRKGRIDENLIEMRMSLVRQKFAEAKRLATDERHMQSKEFQDALEVLSSNKDLFLEFLEEPNSLFSKYFNEPPSHTRRITVLRPSKIEDVSTNQVNSRRPSHVQTESTKIVVLKPSPHPKDESLLSSSALSNGYIGDESSFEDVPSDSWDYTNRIGSPYSSSSIGRASCSPEPSVVKEAKKRLSERWAMVRTNVIYEEQNIVQRSSRTLGEMLSVHKLDGSNNLRLPCDEEQEPKTSSIGCFSTENASRNLVRSKSLPISSSQHENFDLDEVVPNKDILSKQSEKSRNKKSSLREKVSSFFSNTKRSSRQNHVPSLSVGSDDSLHSNNTAEDVHDRNDTSSQSECFPDANRSEASTSTNSEKYGYTAKENHAVPPLTKNSPSYAKPLKMTPRKQDLPSPISLLEAQFEHKAISKSTISIMSENPQALSRSPPIGSISRTLTSDSPHLVKPLQKSSKILPKEYEEEEGFVFVQKLLSSADLVNSGDCTILERWHSLDSPLDPVLLDEFLDRKKEDAKCRERRANQRLLFDYVNAAVLNIGLSTLKQIYPPFVKRNQTFKYERNCPPVAEQVWRGVQYLFSEYNNASCEDESEVIERLIDRDVTGSEWDESMCAEVDEFSKEAVERLLEELIQETLDDLS